MVRYDKNASCSTIHSVEINKTNIKIKQKIKKQQQKIRHGYLNHKNVDRRKNGGLVRKANEDLRSIRIENTAKK